MLDPVTLSITTYSIGGCLPENTIYAVRIKHIPTGIEVSCQRYKDHRANVDAAMTLLERQVNYRANRKLDTPPTE